MDPSSAEARAAIARELFNQAWDLLERTDRSPEDDLAMLGRALGSWALWRRVGEPRNHAVGDWQVSRVFAVLGDPAWAMRYAESGLEICRSRGLGPYLEACAWESVARAAGLAGDTGRRDQAVAAAREAADRVEDPDDRLLVLDDLETID